MENRELLSVSPLNLDCVLLEPEVKCNETSEHVCEKTIRDENGTPFHLDEFLDDIAEQSVAPNVTPTSATISPLVASGGNLLTMVLSPETPLSLAEREYHDSSGGFIDEHSGGSSGGGIESPWKVTIQGEGSQPGYANAYIQFTGTATLGDDYYVLGMGDDYGGYGEGNSRLVYNAADDSTRLYFGFPFHSGGSYQPTFTVLITPRNDGFKENDETIEMALHTYYVPSGGIDCAADDRVLTFTITDDDDWTASVNSVTDKNQVPEPVGNLDMQAEFAITRSGGPDRHYGMTVNFELSGTADNMGKDYRLQAFTKNFDSNGNFLNETHGFSLSHGLVQDANGNTVFGGSVTFPPDSDIDTIWVRVIPNSDAIFENDETVTLKIVKTYATYGVWNTRDLILFDAWPLLEYQQSSYGIHSEQNFAGVTILQAPEFISDTDRDVDTKTRPFDINADAYTGYIKRNAYSGAFIETVTSIDSAHNRDVTYSIMGGNEAGLFWIEASTGKIRTAVHLYEEENLLAAYNLQIKVKDNENDQYDLASVNITISQWNVSRNGNYNAPAVSTVGCTISELAEEIGLDAASFQQWLTFTDDFVTIANGDQIHKDGIGADTLLGANEFRIPNTMYMAWFGEMGIAGQGWMNWGQNVADLQRLGFHVVQFNNDDFDKSNANGVKANFLGGVTWLSNEKFLHGMYMMGHGGTTNVGSSGTRCYTQGPDWSVQYAEIEAQLNYDLGAVIIHACWSNESNAEDLLVSDNGFFVGQTGVYVPLDPERLASHWGESYLPVGIEDILLYGGRQRTQKFEA